MDRNALLALVMLAAVTLGFPGRARAQTCAANVPHVTGTWVTVPYLMPINPISATLLHTGKILIVAGSGEYGAHSRLPANLIRTPNRSG